MNRSIGVLSAVVFVVGCVSLTAFDGATRGDRAQALYDYFEKASIEKGWKKVTLHIGGVQRQLLWKGPAGPWRYGAIIAMHGGGGTHSNFSSGLRLGKPMEEFGDLALRTGFGVFSLDSGDGLAKDAKGRSCGKRWDCTAVDGRESVDLPFIEAVITRTIPELRPAGSAKHIFMTGISNGGFMTMLAATHFPGKLRAFALVSCGDPYGTYMDMGTHPRFERRKAPGVFRDNDTHKLVSQPGAASENASAHEKPWADTGDAKKPPFKQFHHEGDGGCDISCMRRAQRQLLQHGYKDDGPFILKGDTRNVWSHFWKSEYNQPLIEFFVRQATAER